jgi:hypothetical protein
MKDDNGGCLLAGLILIILVVFIPLMIYGPIFTIWALNLLFGFEIPVNFYT